MTDHEVTLHCKEGYQEMEMTLEEFRSLNYCPFCGDSMMEEEMTA